MPKLENSPPWIEPDFRAFVEYLDEAIIGLTLEGIVTSWNPSAEKIFGYRSQEAIGVSLVQLIAPPGLEAEIQENLNTLKRGEHIDVETRRRKKDGSVIPIAGIAVPIKDEAGDSTGYVVAIRDITERKKAEENSRKLAAIIEKTPDAILITDKDGRIEYANPALEKLTGYALSELKGKTPRVFKSGKHDQTFYENLWKTILSGNVFRGTLINRRKNGEEYYQEDTIFPILDGQGRITNFVASFHDVTDKNKTAAALRQSKEEMERACKELEAFSYSVAHDLRSPLQKIDGYSQVILEDHAEKMDAEGKDMLKRLRKISQDMADMIASLLNLSKMARGPMRIETVDLSALAESIAEGLRQSSPARQATFAIQPGLTARGDATLLRNALENLFGNAWKFTGKNPSARIEFGALSQQEPRTYFLLDDGPGFDPALADKLFNPFKRLHDQKDFPGHGIGLATTQRIIARHGGKIWAKSRALHGAAFYFTLSPPTP